MLPNRTVKTIGLTAPSVPSGLTVTASSRTSVTLAWTKSPEPDLDAYGI